MQSTQSGAVDPARAVGTAALRDVLERYDATTGTWGLTKDSEFWRTVQLAHALGIRGAGKRVAVIDGGFDPTVPALRDCAIIGDNPTDPARRLHGTIVALLLLDVAPAAELELYPVAGERGVDTARIVEAFAAATERGAAIINLSIGHDYDIDLAQAVRRWSASAERWPDATEADTDFWLADALSRTDRWTAFFDVPADALVTAVRAAHEAGATVVAAAGNSEEDFFTPAADEAAVSVGFMRELRTSEASGREVALGGDPRWFEQTFFVDFTIEQPLELLGSSFASPLVAGGAALMERPRELYAFRDVARVGALASALVARDDGQRWTYRHRATTVEVFLSALNASPHRHVTAGTVGPCIGCSFWEVQVLIDFGLFHLERFSFDEARRFLECASILAPENPHARANLGMTLARVADVAVEEGRIADASDLLAQAAVEYGMSVRSREGSPALRGTVSRYEARRDEFAEGSADPSLWRERFRLEDEPQAGPSGGPQPHERG